jgi:hypothetical protein
MTWKSRLIARWKQLRRCDKFPLSFASAPAYAGAFFLSVQNAKSIATSRYTDCMSIRSIASIYLACIILLLALTTGTSLALDSASGSGRCHAASAQEIADAQIHGITLSNGQVCDGDMQLFNGSCPESPYPYLLSKYSPGPASSVEGSAGITRLNADFACRLYKFFKAADSAGQNIRIVSAYRSPGTQATLFNAAYQKYGSVDAARHNVAPPPCSANTGAIACGTGSRHNMGIAVDLAFGGSLSNCPDACAWAHAHVEQFGLSFRMGWEPWHVEPSGSVNQGTQIANQGNSGTGMQTGSLPPPFPNTVPAGSPLMTGNMQTGIPQMTQSGIGGILYGMFSSLQQGQQGSSAQGGQSSSFGHTPSPGDLIQALAEKSDYGPGTGGGNNMPRITAIYSNGTNVHITGTTGLQSNPETSATEAYDLIAGNTSYSSQTFGSTGYQNTYKPDNGTSTFLGRMMALLRTFLSPPPQYSTPMQQLVVTGEEGD